MTIRDARDIKIVETLNKYPAVKDGVLRLCEIASADPSKPKIADDIEDIVNFRRLESRGLAED